MTRVPHLQIPFRLDTDGSAMVLEQDSVDEIAQSVQVLLTTVRGQRVELPAYGIPDLVFGTAIDQTVIAQALWWEPRANVVISARPDALDEMVKVVQAIVGAKV